MKIAVIGIGKMGSWIARQLSIENTVAAYDMNPEKAKSVPEAEALGSLPELDSFAPELLLNAVSLKNTVKAFDEALPHLPKDCIISDIASVKGGLHDYYRKCDRRFVSTHPMFGPTFADMEELKKQNAAIIKESDSKGAEFFRNFYASLGLNIFEFSFAEHDDMMAYSLTTPFVSSLVFASCVNGKAVPGTTFAKHMAIAKGLLNEDFHLICEILFNPKSIKQIEVLTAKMEHLKHIIRARDYEEAEEFLAKLKKNLES